MFSWNNHAIDTKGDKVPNNHVLDDWIRRIRSTDPVVFEDAYFGLRPTGPDVIPRLIQELRLSPDSYTRGKFCELLGELGDESVLPVLREELTHPDEDVRGWAGRAMELLQSPARRAAHLDYLRMHSTST